MLSGEDGDSEPGDSTEDLEVTAFVDVALPISS